MPLQYHNIELALSSPYQKTTSSDFGAVLLVFLFLPQAIRSIPCKHDISFNLKINLGSKEKLVDEMKIGRQRKRQAPLSSGVVIANLKRREAKWRYQDRGGGEAVVKEDYYFSVVVRRRIPAIPLPIYPLVTLLTTTWTQDEPFKSRGASSPISDIGLSAFLKVDRFEPSSVFLKASPHHSSLTERAPLLLALLFEPTNLSFETPESFFLSENHGTSFAPVRPVVASGATLILQRVSLYGLDTQFRQMGLNLSFTSTRPNDLIGPVTTSQPPELFAEVLATHHESTCGKMLFSSCLQLFVDLQSFYIRFLYVASMNAFFFVFQNFEFLGTPIYPCNFGFF
ncbi:predicted protein [Arabidopsis lyrata subsp. lyrata]|uniref:Predicted protein n=1 Tax=Arabidopsis lyrata subsp. lyrata TaxID=81972 RepID=D7L2U9_ARALL|nr:predicted protein [Arabidopsis lyrata subsp. lyrata]